MYMTVYMTIIVTIIEIHIAWLAIYIISRA